MTPEESRAIWAKVQTNTAKLDACHGPHRFEDITPDRKVGKTYRCQRCAGETDGINRYWYERGLAHGRGEWPKGVCHYCKVVVPSDANCCPVCADEHGP